MNLDRAAAQNVQLGSGSGAVHFVGGSIHPIAQSKRIRGAVCKGVHRSLVRGRGSTLGAADITGLVAVGGISVGDGSGSLADITGLITGVGVGVGDGSGSTADITGLITAVGILVRADSSGFAALITGLIAGVVVFMVTNGSGFATSVTVGIAIVAVGVTRRCNGNFLTQLTDNRTCTGGFRIRRNNLEGYTIVTLVRRIILAIGKGNGIPCSNGDGFGRPGSLTGSANDLVGIVLDIQLIEISLRRGGILNLDRAVVQNIQNCSGSRAVRFVGGSIYAIAQRERIRRAVCKGVVDSCMRDGGNACPAANIASAVAVGSISVGGGSGSATGIAIHITVVVIAVIGDLTGRAAEVAVCITVVVIAVLTVIDICRYRGAEQTGKEK